MPSALRRTANGALRPRLLARQGRVERLVEELAAFVQVRHPGPDLLRLGRFPEAVAVLLGERLERHQRPLEPRRQRPHDPGLNHRSTLEAAAPTYTRSGMGTRHRLATLALLLLSIGALAAGAHADVVQSGDVRVNFHADFSPIALPRDRTAPITVEVGGKVSTTDGSHPPALRQMRIELNRGGQDRIRRPAGLHRRAVAVDEHRRRPGALRHGPGRDGNLPSADPVLRQADRGERAGARLQRRRRRPRPRC